METRPIYEDLSIRLEADHQSGGFIARILRSPFGLGTPIAFEPPFAADETASLLRDLERWIETPKGAESEVPRGFRPISQRFNRSAADPREIGGRLFESLFRGTLRENLLSCLALVNATPRLGLRLRLVMEPNRIGHLSALPWELLYRTETRTFLNRDLRTPVVRQLEVARAALTPKPVHQLRVLAVLANPHDTIPLNVGAERNQLETTIGAHPSIQLSFLEPPTPEALRRALRTEQIDVLHFVGHGDLDERGVGRLLFEDEHGAPRPVPSAVLADTLKTYSQIRVVCLNSCQTATIPRSNEGHDPYLGTAAALIMAGVPAVVAMQFPISDRAALRFSDSLYQYLASGDPLEAAVTEGRMAILHHQPESWEWMTPVLFLGVPSGALFEVEPGTKAATLVVGATSEQLEAALDHLERGSYGAAIKAFSALRETVPTDARPAYYLALARLNGQRPRSSRLDVIQQIEADLESAGHLLGVGAPAHYWLFRALLKHDFYRFKGMRVDPPTCDEALAEAVEADVDRLELRRLRSHAQMPPGIVRDALDRLLGEVSP